MTTKHPLFGHRDVYDVRVPVATMWTSPDAPRDVDTAAVLDDPDIAGWAETVRTQELVGRTLTQLLLGESVLVVEEAGDWVRCHALMQPDGQASGERSEGYLGWVRRAHLGAPVDRSDGGTAFVVARTALCRTDQDKSVDLSFGTALWVHDVSETSAMVLLPDGHRGTLRKADVRLSHKQQQPTHTPEDLLDTARQFLGLGYIWGGTSAWGLDCSGLVHLTHRALGVSIPRDACDQAASPNVEPVPLEGVRPGDLYFFAKAGARVTHVGFATRALQPDGSRAMLHAPEGGGRIEECPMPAERLATLVSAGRRVG